jgi:hypothetical protein
MWPQFSLNLFSKKNIGTILLGSCLFSNVFAQTDKIPTSPIQTPASVEYPGIIQTFEKIIQVDADKFNNRSKDLVKNGRTFTTSTSVTALDLEPDFLNSIILHSDSSYIKLASMEKCRFYDSIITDLLKSAEGKIQNVLVTYMDSKGKRQSSLMARKDFLNNVVNLDCPMTKKLIDQFQLKNLDQTLKEVSFDIPSGREQCQTVHLNWLGSPKTPYLCQIHEYLDQAKKGLGDPADLTQRKAVAQVIDKKLTQMQKDYLENICKRLDDEDLFCAEFLNVSMWTKIAGGLEDRIYAQGICSFVSGTGDPSDAQLRQCLARMKKETDLCLYQSSKNRGLSPQMNCETLSLALNYSTMRSDYIDCPSHSDQLGVTNLARILLNITKGSIKEFQGPCSNISTGEVLEFNEKYDNEEAWKLQACYDDPLNEKEVCSKVFFGAYHKSPYSLPNVVASALKKMRGAEQSTTCKMVDSREYSPLKMEYKSGCVIIYDANKCFISQCKHKIFYNDRPIDFIKIKNQVTLDYFPTSVQGERFSQQYLLTHDFKRTGKPLSNLTNVIGFFKKSRTGLIHGTGCMEELLPTFMKSQTFGQCTPVPFIIDGMIRENDNVALVTRTALDSLQAPRLVSWSNVFAAVRTYQRYHPLRLWTLYGLD